MADDISKDEPWRMELRAYTEHSINRVNQLFERTLARMNDMISGSGDAEAAVIENTNQRKRPRFEEPKKSRAEIQRMKMELEEMKSKPQLKENENKELRTALKEMNTNQRKRPTFEELQKLETELSVSRAENQRMKMELEEMKSKLQPKENENKEVRTALKEMEENQKQMMQIPRSWEIHGQKFTSFDHCEKWICWQLDGQVCQASDAGPSSLPDLPGFGDIDFDECF